MVYHRKLEAALTINPDMYRTNIQEAITKEQFLICRGTTNAAPTLLQKKAVVEVLNALGFFQRGGVTYLAPSRRW